MERATGPDQRSGELQVRARVDEEPRVLVAEPEKPELLEAPADDALILERQLEGLWWVFRRRHVQAETTGSAVSCWQNVRRGCDRVAPRPPTPPR